MLAIWSYIKNLKLTIAQWMQIMSAAGIAVLVITLKIKNDQLHVARIDLLRQAHEIEEDKADRAIATATKKVSNARFKYVQAIDDYKRSGLSNLN